MINEINSHKFLSTSTIKQAGVVDSTNSICPAIFSFFSCLPSEAPEHQVKRKCFATPIDSYLGKKEMDIQARLTEIPQYVHQFLHPGISYNSNGKIGYQLDKNTHMLSQKQVSDDYQVLLKEFKRNPDIHQQYQANYREMIRSVGEDSKGFHIGILQKDGTSHTILEVSPKKMKNHKKALSSFRDLAGKIETLSHQEINAELLAIHKILLHGMIQTELLGTYRNADGCVYRDQADDQDRSYKNLCDLIIARGGSNDDLKIFKNIFQRLRISTGNMEMALHRAIGKMTEREKKALSWICYAPPHFREIPNLMTQFIKELKETMLEMKRCGRNDPIALAAFVHCKMGEIHPFIDGNGRMARAFMNAILMEYGIKPVVFENEVAYTAAIERNTIKPGYFAEYLREIATPNLEKL